MAKQTGAVQFIGKMANVVGFKNSLAKTPSTKFVRERATSVSNPKSYAQAKQRAKVRPAQIFYDAFVEVLNHAFIPKGRASKNRLEFLSGAMSLDYVPDVMKGEFKLPFAPYQVSRGTLGLDRLTLGEHLNAASTETSAPYDGIIKFPIVFGDQNNPDLSVAEISSNILNNNPQLIEGEEITFLAVVCERNNPNNRFASVLTFVLNRSDNVTVLDSSVLWFHGLDDGVLLYTEIGDYVLLSAALIISSRTDTSWRYTNSFMALSGYAIDGFDWEEVDIIRSYMDAAAAAGTSDLILQQADNDVFSGYAINSVNNVGFTLNTGVTGTPSFNAAAVAAISSSGVMLGRRAVIDAAGQLYNYGERGWSAITLVNEGDTTPLLISQTSLNGSPTISLAEVQAAGF